jgi:hypothetical protein
MVSKIIMALSCAAPLFICAGMLYLYLGLHLGMQAQIESPYGFMDQSGKQVVDLREARNKSYEVSDFCEERAVVAQRYDPQEAYMIDRSGQEVGDTFKRLDQLSEGFAAAQPLDARLDLLPTKNYFSHEKRYLWGFADNSGKLKIKAQFRQVRPFKNGLAAVMPEGSQLWGFIDTSGKLIIPAIYQGADSFSEEIAVVCINEKWGLIDRSGKYVLKPAFDSQIMQFKEGLAAVYEAKYIADPNATIGKFRKTPVDSSRFEISEVKYLNRQGHVALTVHPSPDLSKRFILLNEPNSIIAWDGTDTSCNWGFQHKAGFDFAEGLAVLRQGDKYGFIDQTGKYIIAPQFDYAWTFKEGRAKVYKDIDGGKYSFIDRNGKLISPYLYYSAEEYSEGFARVEKCKNDRPVFIDKSGRPVTFPDYSFSGNFHNGLARIGSQIVYP